MRQIVLDTETTGLDPTAGHRIIEIGCVELVDRRPTGRTFHQYLQPNREIEAGAVSVHGITDAFLRDKPRFGDIAAELLSYLEGAELIIHNASFDLGFLDHEFRLWQGDAPPLADLCPVTDTLILARTLHPSQRNSLDALCKRYGIDNSHRDRHGALLDAEILADVYLAMTGGQVSLFFGGAGQDSPVQRSDHRNAPARLPVDRPRLPVVRASDVELAAHDQQLTVIDKASGGHCLWRRSQRV